MDSDGAARKRSSFPSLDDRDATARDSHKRGRHSEHTGAEEAEGARSRAVGNKPNSDLESIRWDAEDVWAEVAQLFFTSDDYIPSSSPEFQEFKEFFQKYVQFKKISAKNASNVASESESQKRRDLLKDLTEPESSKSRIPFELPSRYDVRYKVNVSVLTEETKRRRSRTPILSAEAVSDVRRGIQLYEDFSQRKAFARLVKIRRDQQALPIAAFEKQICESIRVSPVTIIAGDTGCGKSTQVPQYMLRAGFDRIVCTQPRRIAAMSLCRRVAFETLNEYGSKVAYQIRFETSKAADTRILFMTEGLLLRQYASDPMLSNYSVVIVDEVHERHIQGDFLLCILRSILTKRPNFKLILMSATINIELFSSYFGGAPVIRVPGRMYPVDVIYQPIAATQREDEEMFQRAKDDPNRSASSLKSASSREFDPKPYLRVVEQLDQQYPQNERGDLLIFLPGIKEITTLGDTLKAYGKNNGRWIVLMCHSSLSVEEQEKVFDVAPEGVRKCVIATNICETAVTIDGIRFVIDSGKVKEMGYDNDSKMQSLQEYWVSQASAEQRKGRAGRTGPGTCFRLYSRNEFQHLLEFSVPEIRRIPLESVVLQIKALRMGDPRAFDFLEKPASESLESAILSLKEHQLLLTDSAETITPLGEVLSRLPVDIPIGKMLVLATVFDLVDPVLSIAAALSVQAPFVRTDLSNESAINARRTFESSHGDPFTLLNVYDEWIKIKAQSKENSRKWCRRNFLEEQRLYEMAKLRKQFRDILVDSRLITTADADEDERKQRFGPEERSRRREQTRGLSRAQLRLLQIQQAKSRGRKLLKFEDEMKEPNENATEEDDNDQEDIDLRNIDFLLTHDLRELERASSRALTVKEVDMIKIIIASGLYPNVAVSDEANANRKESDHMFHTRYKNFVLMHPTSSFAGRTSGLTPNDLLIYVTLLQTNKPYLTNSMCASALHTLLLVAQTVDTTPDCSRLIVDNWLEITVQSAKAGERVLVIVHQLRLMLHNLLRAKLAAKFGEIDLPESLARNSTSEHLAEAIENHSLPPFAKRIQRESEQHSMSCSEQVLSEKLAEFVECAIPFKYERLRSANAEALFEVRAGLPPPVLPNKANSATDTMEELETAVKLRDAKFEERKGGVRLNHWLRWGSVRQHRPASEGFSVHMRKHWTCPSCKEQFLFGLKEVEEHEKLCAGAAAATAIPQEIPSELILDSKQRAAEEREAARIEEEQAQLAAGLRQEYICAQCNKTFLFTRPEILRHKASHRAQQPQAVHTLQNEADLKVDIKAEPAE